MTQDSNSARVARGRAQRAGEWAPSGFARWARGQSPLVQRWLALAAYTAVLYGLLPYGPPIGEAVQATALGRFVLGRGAEWIVAAGAVAILWRLRRRAAPASAYVVAGVTALGYALALAWLRSIRLERVHLPEYGIAAWLAWRALVPPMGDRIATYVGAALLASVIGWGDEIVQGMTPGRVFDVRDIAANAAGAVLGTLVVALWRVGAVDRRTVSDVARSGPC